MDHLGIPWENAISVVKSKARAISENVYAKETMCKSRNEASEQLSNNQKNPSFKKSHFLKQNHLKALKYIRIPVAE